MMGGAAGRVNDIAEWRASGLTYAEIGRRLGVTRQAICQVCKQNEISKPPAPPAPQRWPIPKFAMRMKRWLWDAGYRRCPCGIWSERVTAAKRRCPQCNAAATALWNATEEGRAYAREYRVSHPEVYRRGNKKYLAKLRTTEEGRDLLRARSRQSYDRAMSTEEGRERLRAGARERYHRRKEQKP